MPGWGNVFGFFFDYLGSKKERLRKKEAKLKREINEIQQQPNNPGLAKRYDRLSIELRNVRQALRDS